MDRVQRKPTLKLALQASCVRMHDVLAQKSLLLTPTNMILK